MSLNLRQLDELGILVGAFARRLPDEVAGVQMRAIERAGLDNLTFAWAGGIERGHRHYFRIEGPDAAHRARQHPAQRQPHPLRVA